MRVEDGVGLVAGECGRAGDRVDVQYRRGVVRKVGGLVVLLFWVVLPSGESHSRRVHVQRSGECSIRLLPR